MITFSLQDRKTKKYYPYCNLIGDKIRVGKKFIDRNKMLDNYHFNGCIMSKEDASHIQKNAEKISVIKNF